MFLVAAEQRRTERGGEASEKSKSVICSVFHKGGGGTALDLPLI